MFMNSPWHLQVCDESSINYDLLDAVERDDLNDLIHLLENGADPNYYYQLKNGSDGTLLHITSSGKIAEALIRYGAHVDSRNWLSATPLNVAVKNKCVDVVKVLLHCGASVMTIDGLGENVLVTAIKTCDGDLEIIRELINFGASVNRNFLNTYPPLYVAVSCNQLEAIDELIKQGAFLHQKIYGMSVLQFALEKESVNSATIKKLLEAGASCIDDYNYLDVAMSHRDVDTVRELIKHGATIKTDLNSNSTLYKYVFYSRTCPYIVQELLNKGAKTGSYLDKYHVSPIGLAVSHYMDDNIIPQFLKQMLKYSTIEFLHDYERSSHDERVLHLQELANFAGQCILEAQDMKRKMIDEKHSLFDCVKKFVNKSFDTIPLGLDFKNQIFEIFMEKQFPIYEDLIVALLDNEFLLYRISFLKIFACSSNSKIQFLCPDMVQSILSYLPDSDFKNFIFACSESNL